MRQVQGTIEPACDQLLGMPLQCCICDDSEYELIKGGEVCPVISAGNPIRIWVRHQHSEAKASLGFCVGSRKCDHRRAARYGKAN